MADKEETTPNPPAPNQEIPFKKKRLHQISGSNSKTSNPAILEHIENEQKLINSQQSSAEQLKLISTKNQSSKDALTIKKRGSAKNNLVPGLLKNQVSLNEDLQVLENVGQSQKKLPNNASKCSKKPQIDQKTPDLSREPSNLDPMANEAASKTASIIDSRLTPLQEEQYNSGQYGIPQFNEYKQKQIFQKLDILKDQAKRNMINRSGIIMDAQEQSTPGTRSPESNRLYDPSAQSKLIINPYSETLKGNHNFHQFMSPTMNTQHFVTTDLGQNDSFHESQESKVGMVNRIQKQITEIPTVPAQVRITSKQIQRRSNGSPTQSRYNQGSDLSSQIGTEHYTFQEAIELQNQYFSFLYPNITPQQKMNLGLCLMGNTSQTASIRMTGPGSLATSARNFSYQCGSYPIPPPKLRNKQSKIDKNSPIMQKNIGLAMKNAETNNRAIKLLGEAAKSQQKWMYDFSDESPLKIGTMIQKPKPSPKGKQKSSAGQQTDFNQKFNIDLPLTGIQPNEMTISPFAQEDRLDITMKRQRTLQDEQSLDMQDECQVAHEVNSRLAMEEDTSALPAIGESKKKQTSQEPQKDSISIQDKAKIEIKGPSRNRIPVTTTMSRVSKRLSQKSNEKVSEECELRTTLEDQRGLQQNKDKFNLNDVNAETQKLQFEAFQYREGSIDAPSIEGQQTTGIIRPILNSSQGPTPFRSKGSKESTLQLVCHDESRSKSPPGGKTISGAVQIQGTNLIETSLAPQNESDQKLMKQTTEQTFVKIDSTQLEDPIEQITKQMNIKHLQIIEDTPKAPSTMIEIRNDSQQARNSYMSKVSKLDNSTGLDSIMVQAQRMKFHKNSLKFDAIKSTTSQGSPRKNVAHQCQQTALSSGPVSPRSEFQAKHTDKEPLRSSQDSLIRPKPAIGSQVSQINPRLANKSIGRRILLQKQAELMRKHQGKAGVMKSIGDVIRQTKQQKESINRELQLKEKYLSEQHGFWKGQKSIETTEDYSIEEPEKLNKTLENIQIAPKMHYNENLLGNYKYFGARKLPELDKILIQEFDPKSKENSPTVNDSIFNQTQQSVDGISVMPNFSETFGKQVLPMTIPVSKEGQRDKLNLISLRQNLRTESRPRDGLIKNTERDIHTAFLKSQFKGITPATAKNFNNIRKRQFQRNWIGTRGSFGRTAHSIEPFNYYSQGTYDMNQKFNDSFIRTGDQTSIIDLTVSRNSERAALCMTQQPQSRNQQIEAANQSNLHITYMDSSMPSHRASDHLKAKFNIPQALPERNQLPPLGALQSGVEQIRQSMEITQGTGTGNSDNESKRHRKQLLKSAKRETLVIDGTPSPNTPQHNSSIISNTHQDVPLRNQNDPLPTGESLGDPGITRDSYENTTLTMVPIEQKVQPIQTQAKTTRSIETDKNQMVRRNRVQVSKLTSRLEFRSPNIVSGVGNIFGHQALGFLHTNQIFSGASTNMAHNSGFRKNQVKNKKKYQQYLEKHPKLPLRESTGEIIVLAHHKDVGCGIQSPIASKDTDGELLMDIVGMTGPISPSLPVARGPPFVRKKGGKKGTLEMITGQSSMLVSPSKRSPKAESPQGQKQTVYNIIKKTPKQLKVNKYDDTPEREKTATKNGLIDTPTASDIDCKEDKIDILYPVKGILSQMFNYKAMIGPQGHTEHMDSIQDKSQNTPLIENMRLLNYSIVNANKRNKTHIPQEILFCQNLVKGHECPGLKEHCEKQIIMEYNSCGYNDTPLGQKHEYRIVGRSCLIIQLINQVKIH